MDQEAKTISSATDTNLPAQEDTHALAVVSEEERTLSPSQEDEVTTTSSDEETSCLSKKEDIIIEKDYEERSEAQEDHVRAEGSLEEHHKDIAVAPGEEHSSKPSNAIDRKNSLEASEILNSTDITPTSYTKQPSK